MSYKVEKGFTFKIDQKLPSKNGTFYLVMQADGNLVVYRDGVGPIWASNTQFNGKRAVFQPDGNLVVYNSDDDSAPTWASGTNGPKPHNLIMLDRFALFYIFD
jgi:hypothetical protein